MVERTRTEDVPDWNDTRQELDHLLRMRAVRVVKVEAVADLFDRDGVLLRAVFEDELFEEQEGALVRHFLAHLHERFPGVFRGEAGAVGALAVLDEVLDLEYLLKDRIR